MKSRYILLIAGLFAAGSAMAQTGYYQDALLFSRTNSFGSSARIQGIGGSQVSLGGDVSSAGSNPAGLGFFNKSVFSITPSVNFHDANGIYQGNLVASYQPNVNLQNMGVVLNHSIGDIPDSKFKGGSFAISVTRINDFNQQFAYEGYSARTSVADAFLVNAGTTLPENLPEMEYGAYSTYLIDPLYNDQDEIVGYSTFAGFEPLQTERVEISGGQNQMNFSWGGNYNDMVYFGAGMGIQTLKYKRKRFYSESDFLDDANDLLSLSINDELTINGTGLNGTFGMIVRPINFLTMGVSYTTPTYFALRDESGFSMSASYNNIQYDDNTVLANESYVSDITIGNYNLRTPGRLSLGATAFIGKYGFITGDVEFVDHASAVLQSNNVEFDMNADNNEIVNLYTNVVNYRLGAEVRLEDFRVRGGFSHQADPYRDADYDRTKNFVTFGAGFRQKDWFVDLAVVKSLFDQYYSPYNAPDPADQPVVNVENDNTTISATFGVNF
ncbi:MAG: hypothetical protein ABJG41_06380 [Cyclobacteriaceae bacterium]